MSASPEPKRGHGSFEIDVPTGRAEVTIRSRQRLQPLNVSLLRHITRHVLTEELRARDFSVCFHFVDAPEMTRVNEQFLQHAGSTDVITFDYAESAHAQSGLVHGEIFICVADAMKQADEFGTIWQSELVRYVIHALLHLRGYDDLEPAARRIMKREENRLLRAAAARFPIPQVARAIPR